MNLSDGRVLATPQLSGTDRARILQEYGASGLRKIEASLAANLLQRKALERQLANYKLTYPYSSDSLTSNR